MLMNSNDLVAPNDHKRRNKKKAKSKTNTQTTSTTIGITIVALFLAIAIPTLMAMSAVHTPTFGAHVQTRSATATYTPPTTTGHVETAITRVITPSATIDQSN